MSVQAVEINLGATASGMQSAPAILLSPTFRGSFLVLCWFLLHLVEVSESLLAQISCFSGCPHHILTPPTLQLDIDCSMQCSTEGLCFYFCLLLDESSMVTFKILIILTTKARLVRAHFLLLLMVLAAFILVDSLEFLYY